MIVETFLGFLIIASYVFVNRMVKRLCIRLLHGIRSKVSSNYSEFSLSCQETK